MRPTSGVVALIDFMPPRGKASDVVRLVRGISGRVKLRMQLVIRFGFGADVPWVKKNPDGSGLLAICGQDMTVLRTPVETRGEDLTTVADFEVGEGETVPFVLTYGPSHLPVPDADRSRARARRKPKRSGRNGAATAPMKAIIATLVMRSLITLKALTFAPTGGIVAAPTTSLPEKLGGQRNWDYRFCWLRDATFTLLALMNSGYTEEASAWHNWLLRAVAGSPANMQIMYGIMGQRRLLEWEAGWLPGYEGAQPVRVGNAAHAQLQLDVYGELIDAFHQSRVAKLKLDEGSWALECTVLEHLAKVWDQPDHGIWERRGDGKHYVSSKVMTWVAFDRGIKSAETVRLQGAARKMAGRARRHQPRRLRKRLRSRAEFVRGVLRLETARCQHPDAAVGGIPAAVGFPRARHADGDRTASDAGWLCATARSPRSLR